MLDLAVLGLLRDGPLHGYELKRRLSEYGFWRVSFGSLYPALRRLERSGHIGVAPEAGRRKVYELTPEGKAYFQELLEDDTTEAEEERAFIIRLAFFKYLDPDSRLGVLERRRAHLMRRLADARVSAKKSAQRTRERMDRYTLALMERSVQSVEADIEWLDELIETERAHRPQRRERRAPDTAPEIT